MKCFDPAILMKFAGIAMTYAMGDVFEMESVNYLDSAIYTALSQSKLTIAALLLWGIDGAAQSLMQWPILFITDAQDFQAYPTALPAGRKEVTAPPRFQSMLLRSSSFVLRTALLTVGFSLSRSTSMPRTTTPPDTR